MLWLCATGVDGAGSPRLWLWAVDRLSGVTMNGVPRTAVVRASLETEPREAPAGNAMDEITGAVSFLDRTKARRRAGDMLASRAP